MTMRPAHYVAICPDCEGSKDLDMLPLGSAFWPRCTECCQPMNIYARQPTVANGETAPVKEG